ncbi:MAG: FkbM family methyltransferase [Acidimicrobiales bacterium]
MPFIDRLRHRFRATPLPPHERFETDVGPLLLPAHDQVMRVLIGRDGLWEQEESEQLRALLRPGMSFVDIGAHVGYMSLLGARAVGPSGQGEAVEPAPGNLPLLRANLKANGVTNVSVIAAAAWSCAATLPFSLSPANTGDNRAFAVSGTEMIEVPAVALDEVLPPDRTFEVVKVDAQGTDQRAIAGMEKTLRRSRSVLVVEFWPPGITEFGDSPLEVLAYYRDLGFDLRVVGEAQDGTPISLPWVIELCAARPTEFCNLVLRPTW